MRTKQDGCLAAEHDTVLGMLVVLMKGDNVHGDNAVAADFPLRTITTSNHFFKTESHSVVQASLEPTM